MPFRRADVFPVFHRPKVSYAVSIVRMKSVKGRHKSARSKTKRRASENEYSVENVARSGYLNQWYFRWIFPPVKIKTSTIVVFIFSFNPPREVFHARCSSLQCAGKCASRASIASVNALEELLVNYVDAIKAELSHKAAGLTRES